MRSTGARVAETLDEASRVIAARTAIMGEAMATPSSANHGELARMLPEKIEAFTRAGSAVAAKWAGNQSLCMRHTQYPATMTMRGRPPTIAEFADLGERTFSLMLRSGRGERQAGLGGPRALANAGACQCPPP